MSHVAHMNEFCLASEWGVMSWIYFLFYEEQQFASEKTSATYEWVTSHVWMSHVTHINESLHTYEWVMLHIWMSHVTNMNQSCHTYEWFTSHIWMRHVTHMHDSRHTYELFMSLMWMSHVNESCYSYEWILCHTYRFSFTRSSSSDRRVPLLRPSTLLDTMSLVLAPGDCHICK